MAELRRTKVSNLLERYDGIVRLHDLADAYQRYKESKPSTLGYPQRSILTSLKMKMRRNSKSYFKAFRQCLATCGPTWQCSLQGFQSCRECDICTCNHRNRHDCLSYNDRIIP